MMSTMIEQAVSHYRIIGELEMGVVCNAVVTHLEASSFSSFLLKDFAGPPPSASRSNAAA
jgi:hypothetical protein